MNPKFLVTEAMLATISQSSRLSWLLAGELKKDIKSKELCISHATDESRVSTHSSFPPRKGISSSYMLVVFPSVSFLLHGYVFPHYNREPILHGRPSRFNQRSQSSREPRAP